MGHNLNTRAACATPGERQDYKVITVIVALGGGISIMPQRED